MSARRAVLNVAQGRILIFANPIAGRGRGAELARRLETGLSEHGYAVEICLDRVNSFDQARLNEPEVARAAIVIGGDGTLRGVAHHLFLEGHGGTAERRPASEVPSPPLLIVPLGTAKSRIRLGLARLRQECPALAQEAA